MKTQHRKIEGRLKNLLSNTLWNAYVHDDTIEIRYIVSEGIDTEEFEALVKGASSYSDLITKEMTKDTRALGLKKYKFFIDDELNPIIEFTDIKH